MAEYFLAPALEQLRNEVNARFPDRDKASDGWIGDPSHQARPSDHNPDWDAEGRSEGIVRALDVDISPDGRPRRSLRRRLLSVTVGDPRVWYVIANGKIYSRTYNFRARRYHGDPHDGHVHISLNGANGVDPSGNFDTDAWFPRKRGKRVRFRKSHFRNSRPHWDISILDDAVRDGRRDLKRHVDEIERAIGSINPDIKNEDVQHFLRAFRKRRVVKLHLLTDVPPRFTRVTAARSVLRQTIKRIIS